MKEKKEGKEEEEKEKRRMKSGVAIGREL